MPPGKSKYTEACAKARESTNAKAVLLLVLGGDHGDSFEIQVTNVAILSILPALMRDVADTIEADLKRAIEEERI